MQKSYGIVKIVFGILMIGCNVALLSLRTYSSLYMHGFVPGFTVKYTFVFVFYIFLCSCFIL